MAGSEPALSLPGRGWQDHDHPEHFRERVGKIVKQKPGGAGAQVKLATFRLLQQIRLWIYIALLIWGFAMLAYGGDRHDGTGAVLAIIAMALVYLEVCPRCGKQVWHEGQRGWWMWWIIVPARAWWIGTECREPERKEPGL